MRKYTQRRYELIKGKSLLDKHNLDVSHLFKGPAFAIIL